MKSLLTVLLCLNSFILFGQEAEPLSFSEVVNTDTSLKKDDLYKRAKTWFARNYISSQNVIQLDDRESGKIIGKGAIQYSNNTLTGDASAGWIRYTITVQVKDAKYRLLLENFIHESIKSGYSFGQITLAQECPANVPMTSQKWRDKIWKDIQQIIATYHDNSLESLRKAMRQKDSVDDWVP